MKSIQLLLMNQLGTRNDYRRFETYATIPHALQRFIIVVGFYQLSPTENL